MVFNNRMEDEMSHSDFSKRAGHSDMCECLFNSAPLSCHKESVYRVWLRFGPSWRVPLHAKNLDIPWREPLFKAKLESMVSKDGVIYEHSVRELDASVEYKDSEMLMILAQLNVIYAFITCHADSKCRGELPWSQ